MTSKAKRFRIVTAVDYSETGDRALEEALDIAGRHESSELHVVHVIDPSRRGWAHMAESEKDTAAAEARDSLHGHTVRELFARGRTKQALSPGGLSIHVRIGPPGPQIVRLAADVDADLIVVGTHGRRGVERLILGSVAEKVLRLARCPVLVVRPKEYAATEPPCALCVRARTESNGKLWWCEDHQHPARRPVAFGHTAEVEPPKPPVS